jgi:transposase InsO family protein
MQSIADSTAKEAIEPGTLTLHADRGSSMRSKPVADLLVDLGIVKSHSRPYVSDDNPLYVAAEDMLRDGWKAGIHIADPGLQPAHMYWEIFS